MPHLITGTVPVEGCIAGALRAPPIKNMITNGNKAPTPPCRSHHGGMVSASFLPLDGPLNKSFNQVVQKQKKQKKHTPFFQ